LSAKLSGGKIIWAHDTDFGQSSSMFLTVTPVLNVPSSQVDEVIFSFIISATSFESYIEIRRLQ
jgi:hypothetical protein